MIIHEQNAYSFMPKKEKEIVNNTVQYSGHLLLYACAYYYKHMIGAVHKRRCLKIRIYDDSLPLWFVLVHKVYVHQFLGTTFGSGKKSC